MIKITFNEAVRILDTIPQTMLTWDIGGQTYLIGAGFEILVLSEEQKGLFPEKAPQTNNL